MAIVVLLAVIYTMLLTPVNALLSVDKFNRGSLVYLILITGGLVSGVRSDNPNPPGFSAKFISVSHAESDIFLRYLDGSTEMQDLKTRDQIHFVGGVENTKKNILNFIILYYRVALFTLSNFIYYPHFIRLYGYEWIWKLLLWLSSTLVEEKPLRFTVVLIIIFFQTLIFEVTERIPCILSHNIRSWCNLIMHHQKVTQNSQNWHFEDRVRH